MRTIKLFNSKTNALQELTSMSNGLTWGNLIGSITGYEDGMKGINRANQNSYETNESQLPDGDLIIFLVPAKVKSGE